MRTPVATLLSSPRTVIGVAVLWLLLSGFSTGSAVLGIAVGLLVAAASAPYWPERPRLRRPLLVLSYVGIVVWDIAVSCLRVARLVLTRRGDRLTSRFVVVPLDIASPEAIAVLSGTITMTPGTLSADLSADGTRLLVHCLDADDPDAVVAGIKQRYEARLKEIFP